MLDIAYDDFIRTTEPRHYTAVQQFLQTIYDNGDIELGDLRRPLLRLVRGVLHRRRAGRRLDARSTCGRSSTSTEENYFFRLSRYEDRLLE